jgi:hypothetical protein
MKKFDGYEATKNHLIKALIEYIDKDEDDVLIGIDEGIYDKKDNVENLKRMKELKELAHKFNDMSPKVILNCSGGVIQEAFASAHIIFMNLDWDIFEDGPPHGHNIEFKDRDFSHVVDVRHGISFEKLERDFKSEWTKALKKSMK